MAKRTKKKGPRETILEPLERASAAQKKEWERAEKDIRRLRGGGSKLYDELWEIVDVVMRRELYRAGGMRTEAAFIAKMLPGEDKRSVARNRMVAIAFTPRDEETLGVGFLEEIVRYVQELTGSRELPRAIDLDRLRIPVERADGDVVRKPARSCTREEVVAAREAIGKKKSRVPTDAEAAITSVLPKRKAFTKVKVRTSKTHASFSGVPLEELQSFGRALAKLELPR